MARPFVRDPVRLESGLDTRLIDFDHEVAVVVVRQFYDRLRDPQPFWLGPREAAKSQRIIEQVYAGGYAG